MGLPPLSEEVVHALGPWQWIKHSTLWIFVYLMMEFILKDPSLKNSVQKEAVQKDPVQKDVAQRTQHKRTLQHMVTSIEP